MRAILAFFALMFSAALPATAAPMRSVDPPTADSPGYLSTSAPTAMFAIAGEPAMIGDRPTDGDQKFPLDTSGGRSLGGNINYVGAFDARCAIDDVVAQA